MQLAHYLGYFLMALPASWLATKLGYKGGIIAGLLMVGVGGFWFIPATKIAAFWAFLLGVCIVAAGLSFLEGGFGITFRIQKGSLFHRCLHSVPLHAGSDLLRCSTG